MREAFEQAIRANPDNMFGHVAFAEEEDGPPSTTLRAALARSSEQAYISNMPDLTRLLDAAAAGDRRAAAELLPLVYDELRKLAAARMAAESPNQTLQPTALVHEAYLRLVGRADGDRWDGRGHFFAAAAEAMRRILIEAARRKHGPEHGGHLARHDLDPEHPAEPGRSARLLALDEALDRLAAVEPRAAEVVKLRYFAGLTVAEAAAALGISPRTADADWAYARAWLVAALRDDG